ncbi:MAG: alpha/beta fold hydrolase [Alphaproteobacteria bacterium]|nr:alpha/beta fold hydrolase [Alphaproteobacteria bacterium]
MNRPTQAHPETTPASAALAVVEALYAFAEEPARWEDVIAAIDALPAPLDPAHDAVAASIMSHAARAAAMMERLNAGRALAAEPAAAWDAILLSSEGRVRAVAGKAAERLAPFLQQSPTPGEALHFNRSSTPSMETALKAVHDDATAALAPFTLASADDTARAFGIVVPREAFPQSLAAAFELGPLWAEPLFAVVVLSLRDGQAASGVAAHRRLGLTAAEARLTAKLVQGLSLSDAAAELSISTHTARTQLKSIFAKTGVRRQSELLRLLTEISTLPESPKTPSTLRDSPPRRFVTLADGRQLFYREYGEVTGAPILYFHVGLAASLVIPEISRGVAKQRLRLIAFERPGYGQSTPCKSYTFDSIAADAEELLRQLNIGSVALFGDGYGGGFAVATALRLRGAVKRLALKSPLLGAALSNDSLPIRMALMRQRWIIPGVAELLHRGIRVSLVRALMRFYAERSKSDAARAADTEFAAFFDASVFDAFEKTGAGLSAELTLFASGLRSDPTPLTCPIAVWHGADHPGIPASESIATFGGHPNATVHILPDTGSYLRQSIFDDIFTWLGQP